MVNVTEKSVYLLVHLQNRLCDVIARTTNHSDHGEEVVVQHVWNTNKLSGLKISPRFKNAYPWPRSEPRPQTLQRTSEFAFLLWQASGQTRRYE